MKKYLLCAYFLFACFILWGQQVVSSAGDTKFASGYEVSWSIGETLIETFSAETTILTQGFHQTKLVVTSINDIVKNNIEAEIYPNPTQKYIIIKYSELTENFGFAVFDMSGRKLDQGEINSSETRVSFKNRARGTYFLTLISDKNRFVQTFKIVKE